MRCGPIIIMLALVETMVRRGLGAKRGWPDQVRLWRL